MVFPYSEVKEKSTFALSLLPPSHTLCQGPVSYQIIAYFTRWKKLINAGVKCRIRDDEQQHQGAGCTRGRQTEYKIHKIPNTHSPNTKYTSLNTNSMGWLHKRARGCQTTVTISLRPLTHPSLFGICLLGYPTILYYGWDTMLYYTLSWIPPCKRFPTQAYLAYACWDTLLYYIMGGIPCYMPAGIPYYVILWVGYHAILYTVMDTTMYKISHPSLFGICLVGYHAILYLVIDTPM